MRAALAFVASRALARVPSAPADVALRVDDARGRVVVTWAPGPRAGRFNLEDEEHVVSVRFADGACEEALRGASDGGWMDVYVGTGREFAMAVPEGARGGRLEARARAENAAGASAWVEARRIESEGEGEGEGEGERAWGAQWGKGVDRREG